MPVIDFISDITSIDKIYLVLIFKTLISFIVLDIIKKLILRFLKNINNNKKEYIIGQYIKYGVSITKLV